MNARFEIVDYKYWEHVSGRRASVHGAVPYYNDEQAKDWSIKTNGYGYFDFNRNTYHGPGVPFKTIADAKKHLERFGSVVCNLKQD